MGSAQAPSLGKVGDRQRACAAEDKGRGIGRGRIQDGGTPVLPLPPKWGGGGGALQGTPPPTPTSKVPEDSPIQSLKTGVRALLTELAPEETEETTLETNVPERKELSAETVPIGAVKDDDDHE